MADSWDETNVTDIEISPDGRIHIFGASREMMDILQSSGWQDDRERRRLNRRRSSRERNEVQRVEQEGNG